MGNNTSTSSVPVTLLRDGGRGSGTKLTLRDVRKTIELINGVDGENPDDIWLVECDAKYEAIVKKEVERIQHDVQIQWSAVVGTAGCLLGGAGAVTTGALGVGAIAVGAAFPPLLIVVGGVLFVYGIYRCVTTKHTTKTRRFTIKLDRVIHSAPPPTATLPTTVSVALGPALPDPAPAPAPAPSLSPPLPPTLTTPLPPTLTTPLPPTLTTPLLHTPTNHIEGEAEDDQIEGEAEDDQIDSEDEEGPIELVDVPLGPGARYPKVKNGRAILIGNSSPTLPGPKRDLKRATEFLTDRDWASNRITCLHNQPAKKTWKALKAVAGALLRGETQADCVFVLVSSHGGRTSEGREFFDTPDGGRIMVQNVMDLFAPLKGVPKIFIFDKCRVNAARKGGAPADTFIIFSTEGGRVSHDTKYGSPFLNRFWLANDGDTDIVGAVDRCREQLKSEWRQMPEILTPDEASDPKELVL